MKRILFYTNSSSKTGLGHLIRCTALAKECNKLGINCNIYGPSLCLNKGRENVFDEWIEDEERDCIIESQNKLQEYISKVPYSLTVFDDYAVRNDLLKEARRYCKVTSFHRENLDLDNIDIIVNAIPFTSTSQYKEFNKNPTIECLFGPEYAILRPEIRNYNFRKEKKDISKVLVTLGGSDDKGGLIKIIDLFQNQNAEYKVTVICGDQNSNYGKIKQYIERKDLSNVRVIKHSKIPFEEYCGHDCAITAGGMTTYEMAYLGIPNMIVSTAKNQLLLSKAWETMKVAKYLGEIEKLSSDELKKGLKEFLSVYKSLNKKRKVDGLGAVRVARTINKLI